MAAALVGMALAGTWWAVNHTTWAGPVTANGLRTMVGTDGVAKLEDLAYGVQDRVNQARRSDEAPQAYWSTAPVAASAAFHPTDAGPMLKDFGAAGDGLWVPVTDDRGGVSMYKTLVHPDQKRSWTEVFVYAIDYTQFDLHLVAGFQEPKSATPEGLAKFREGTAARTAIIPENDRDRLVAAFNGGFMAQHGHWGMRVDGITLLPPKPGGCTVARLQDGTLRIGTFTALAADAENAGWYRQTPPCMIEQGKLHPGLDNPDAKSWGCHAQRRDDYSTECDRARSLRACDVCRDGQLDKCACARARDAARGRH